jgi:tRNA threonylcarbamoyladenosine biosynthesis protein TsaB
MSAKTFAYATGCSLLAIDTFAAIARNSPPDLGAVEVLADAQQGKVYAQRFRRIDHSDDWQPDSPLIIQSLEAWKASHASTMALSGPGLDVYVPQVSSSIRILDRALWHPTLESILGIGFARQERAEQDDLWTVEPLYLRASSAEEKWQQKGV